MFGEVTLKRGFDKNDMLLELLDIWFFLFVSPPAWVHISGINIFLTYTERHAHSAISWFYSLLFWPLCPQESPTPASLPLLCSPLFFQSLHLLAGAWHHLEVLFGWQQSVCGGKAMLWLEASLLPSATRMSSKVIFQLSKNKSWDVWLVELGAKGVYSDNIWLTTQKNSDSNCVTKRFSTSLFTLLPPCENSVCNPRAGFDFPHKQPLTANSLHNSTELSRKLGTNTQRPRSYLYT